jgi:hypothetical protein
MPNSAPMPEALPPVVVCADDFGLTRRISETIASLARGQCVNAVSCMAALPGWRADAPLLAEIHDPSDQLASRVQVGLHLVLSSERPLTALSRRDAQGRLPGPDRLLVLAHFRRLNLAELAREVDAQFRAFAAEIGRPPDFVDAHEHVHVYPGIRDVVIAATREHAPRAWVRNPADCLSAMLQRPFFPKALGSALHSAGFRAALRRAGLRSNDSFAGHYDFAAGYETLLPQFFQSRGEHHLVMCHPGAGNSPDDPIAGARQSEAAVWGAMALPERLISLQSSI